MKTKGWQQIFKFTFVQHIKTKSFIIGTTILCVLIAAAAVFLNILPSLLTDDGDASIGGSVGEYTRFERIILLDDANILQNDDLELISRSLGRAAFADKSADETEKELIDSEDALAFVHITARLDDNGETLSYSIQTRYSSAAGSDSADVLNAMTAELINRRTLLDLGVSPEDYPKTQIPVSTSRVEAGNSEWSIVKSAMNYFVPIVVTLVLFIFIYSYGGLVAQSIANEKSGRVIELLLTSVRPLAIVIGKVLAMGLVSLGQFILLGVVGGTAFAISAPFGSAKIAGGAAGLEQISSIAGTAELTPDNAEIAELMSEISAAFSPQNILLIALIFILGFMFFAMLAALVGASVSRSEDLQQAMQPYAIIGILGMYLAYFPVIFNADSIGSGEASINPVQIFSYFFPISSPFALPSAIMLKTIPPVQIAAAVAILALMVVLMAMLVSKVYEAMILHNGSRLRMKDIIKLAARK